MVLGSGIASVAAAQEDHWSVTVAPYGWMMSLDGKTTVRGTTSDVDVGFDTILEDLDFGAMADIRVDYDQFGAFLNVVYGKVGADAGSSVGPISIKTDLSIALTFLDFGVSYRFDPIPLGGSASGQPAPSLTIEPYVGGR
ncbi:MAG TPA: hypothetical protein VMX97_11785 [Hyphomicrobiaceae bacterium]|nr:hypothetical protein [Hyphomicrobiaceae bacterium]